MILLLDVASPVPEFHLINENKVIQTIKIVQDINQKLSDNIIPVYLKIDNSFLFINFMKKNKVETKKINGSVSKTTEGTLRKDKKTG